MGSKNMIELNNLLKEYSISGNDKVVALNDISLSINASGIIAVVGKSGSGKTTLLNIMGGLDKPTSGDVVVNGERLNFSNNKQLDLYRNYIVSFIFQDYNLLEDYSVFDNVKLGVKIQGIKKAYSEKRILDALKQVGLEGFEKRKISTLSGGQKQRVAIARALCKESKIVLCDEPTGNLDSKTSNEIFEVIKTLSKDRVFIVVTHDEDSALKYADRIIKISDGKVVDDLTVISNNEIENKNTDVGKCAVEQKRRKTYGLGALNCLQMVRHNIVHFAFSSIALFLLLTLCFTLVSIFISLSQYNERDAFVNTLKTNQQYILSVTKYVDQVINLGNGNISYGYTVAYDMAQESDIQLLEKDLPTTVDVYPSYNLIKPFTDFENIKLQSFSDAGYANAFKEAIAVDDFSNFNSPLLFGKYPQEENDILIYDYMARSLIEQNIFKGNIDRIVGATLTDSTTGISMKISGILKSQYKNYIGLSKESNNYDYAISYLSGLKVIFCKPTFIKQVCNSDYLSIIDCSVVWNIDDEKNRLDFNATKIKTITATNLNFYVTASDFADNNGIIISKNALAKILNKPLDELNEEIARNFIENYTMEFGVLYNDVGLYPMQSYISTNNIIAVCNEDIDSDGVICFYSKDNYNYFMSENGRFRQIYIGLCDEWTDNTTVVNYFWYHEEKTLQFYEDNPEYYDEVYCIYDPIGVLITDADYYLANVRELSTIINYIVLGLSFVVVLIYTFMTLQRYNYKIGVLKALGTKTLNIILVFGLQLLIISICAFILSVPLSELLILLINNLFVRDINTNLVFFGLTFSSTAIAFAIATLGIIIVSGIPLLKLALDSPIKTINHGRKKL